MKKIIAAIFISLFLIGCGTDQTAQPGEPIGQTNPELYDYGHMRRVPTHPNQWVWCRVYGARVNYATESCDWVDYHERYRPDDAHPKV